MRPAPYAEGRAFFAVEIGSVVSPHQPTARTFVWTSAEDPAVSSEGEGHEVFDQDVISVAIIGDQLFLVREMA